MAPNDKMDVVGLALKIADYRERTGASLEEVVNAVRKHNDAPVEAGEVSPALLVKIEMKRRGKSYKELSRALAELGIDEKPQSIANAISRDALRADRFLAYLTAIGCKKIHLSDATPTPRRPHGEN